MSPELVIFGLGSNLGNREAYLWQAVAALSKNSTLNLSAVKTSGTMETPALLPEGAPADWNIPFLNMAMSGHTTANAEIILFEVKKIETEIGRQHRGHWGPREIDIDILALGSQIIATDSLTIPHPHMQSRLFVMQPLAEIVPGWVHPGSGKTAVEMLASLRSNNS